MTDMRDWLQDMSYFSVEESFAIERVGPLESGTIALQCHGTPLSE